MRNMINSMVTRFILNILTRVRMLLFSISAVWKVPNTNYEPDNIDIFGNFYHQSLVPYRFHDERP